MAFSNSIPFCIGFWKAFLPDMSPMPPARFIDNGGFYGLLQVISIHYGKQPVSIFYIYSPGDGAFLNDFAALTKLPKSHPLTTPTNNVAASINTLEMDMLQKRN